MSWHIETVGWPAGGGNYMVKRAGETLQTGVILEATHPSGRPANDDELVGLSRWCAEVWDAPEGTPA